MAESSWYDRLDAVVGGILPGGVPLGTTSRELGMAEAPGAAVGQMVAGGAMPAARAAGPRGRTMTAIATVYPDGSTVPRSITPGGVALYSRDLTAYNKVIKIARKIAPAARRRKGKVRRKR